MKVRVPAVLFLSASLLIAATWKGSVEIGTRSFPVELEITGNACFLVVDGTDGLSGRCTLLADPDRDRAGKLAFSVGNGAMTWRAEVNGDMATGTYRAKLPLTKDPASSTGQFVLTTDRPGPVYLPDVGPPDRTLVWGNNTGNRYYAQGVEYERLQADGLTVVVSVKAAPPWLVATVGIVNGSNGEVDALPSGFTAEIAGTWRRAATVDQVLNHQDIASVLRQLPANLAYLNQCNVIMEDPSHALCVQQKQSELQQQRQQVAYRVRASALLATTTPPGGYVVGYVYFLIPGRFVTTLRGSVNVDVPLGERVFRFPFHF
jgi:hypothetical protein